jgi:hypothetical protein
MNPSAPGIGGIGQFNASKAIDSIEPIPTLLPIGKQAQQLQ